MDSPKMSRLADAARKSVRHRRKKKGQHKDADAVWDLEDIRKSLAPGKAEKDALVRAGDWEFAPEKLKNLTELGAGNFGKVYVGIAVGILKGQKETTVAIKTLTSKGSKVKKEFMQEAGIMQQLDGPHHIVRLLGVCTTKAPNYMIMEFLSRGDLKELLRHTRPKGGKPSDLTLHRLVSMSADIAEGMAFLASMKIVHRDLAARNCLVAEDYTVKVGDFGLTRDVHQNDYYRMTGSAALPIRWMAPESLMDGVFTSMSDVWAFGIVLWEIITFGKVPYPLMTNEEVMDQVCDLEYKMPAPKKCPPEFFEVMDSCWHFEADSRPPFESLFSTLTGLIAKIPNSPYVPSNVTESAKAAIASTYSIPQDAIVAYEEEDSADEEEEYTPYNIAAADMKEYSRCDAYQPIDEDSYALVEKPVRQMEATSVAVANVDEDDDDDETGDDPHLYAMADGKIKSKPGAGRKAKLSAEDQRADVVAWIERVVGTKQEGTLHEWLKSGTLLCRLMNTIQRDSISRFHLNTKRAFKMMENISWFLDAATKYGVRSSDLFVTRDLFEEEAMDRVVSALASLKNLAESKGFKK